MRAKYILAVLLMTTTLAPRAQDRGDAGAQAAVRALRPSVPGVHGLVTSANPLASMAGARVLLSGGNAFDAAVAVATVLNVVEPQSSSIAGNGFATIYDRTTGHVHSLAMAGAAPKGLNVAEMTPELLNSGMKAAIVPGNLGGLVAMLSRFGSMPLADVLAPAIEYAEHGHPANEAFAAGVRSSQKLLARTPTSAALFMPAGRLPEPGDVVRNADLAATLKKLVEAEANALEQGATRAAALQAAHDRFYKGDIAAEIARYLQANGGIMTRADLAAYQPRWETPLRTSYRGYDVYSNGSTSRGGFEVLMQLNLVEAFDLSALGFGNPKALHLLAEAIKIAKSDIYKYVADPAFAKVPVGGMLSKAYAADRRKLIDVARAITYPEPGNPAGAALSVQAAAPAAPTFPERYAPDPETTSFSIVDRYGNAVAVTPTIGGGMGTGVVVGSTGLLFNNGLRLGSTSPYPDNVNYVRAGQVPILNNSPVIVLKDGQFVLALGTPGGETIGQTQFQGIVNVIDFGMSIQEAIEAPRFRVDADPNFYKPGAETTVAVERRLPPATIAALQAMGHTVRLLPEYTPGVGGMQGILVNLRTKTMTAGADPRRAGYAIGW